MRHLALMALLLIASGNGEAGNLNKTGWKPSGCGGKPEAPMIDDSSIEAYNASVETLKEWQKTSTVYYDCMIKEANADNRLITDTAMKEQEAFREETSAINESLKAARARLNPE